MQTALARRGSVAAVVGALLVAGAGPARGEGGPLRVAIDPGHGGSNLGAPGTVEGVYEKRLTLALGRLLRRRLEHEGVQVVQTRDADQYVTLGQRVRTANASGADVFLSLHANAFPDHSRRGFNAYLLARDATDVQARKAGERETDLADAVVARARVRQTALSSSRLAAEVRARLSRVRDTDLGTRQAPLDVLDGLHMPAILVEIGFIDHADEGRELLDPDVLRGIATAIADGVLAWAAQGGPAARAPAAAMGAGTSSVEPPPENSSEAPPASSPEARP